MPGLVPGIHVFFFFEARSDVDGRDRPGHDGDNTSSNQEGFSAA
jgi:hypothetical protein